MKKTKFLLLLLFIQCGNSYLQAQNRRSIPEDSAIVLDGVELGYVITEEDSRNAGKEEFARFKISFFANNGGCPRVYPIRESNSGSATGLQPENTVATFYVRNANGKRLTSRDTRILANEWWVPVRLKEKDAEGKEITRVRELMAGHIFRVGDHLETSIIVLVPKDERPVVDIILARAAGL